MTNTTNTMANTMTNVTQNNFNNLVAGQRYLFYSKLPVIKNDTNEITETTESNNNNTIETTEVLFRANFIEIIANNAGRTIRLDNVDCEERGEINQCGVLTMPLDWITRVESHIIMR
jgi:hypothetical protein